MIIPDKLIFNSSFRSFSVSGPSRRSPKQCIIKK